VEQVLGGERERKYNGEGTSVRSGEWRSGVDRSAGSMGDGIEVYLEGAGRK
jgi:hypothetical protein